jgi:hypothetical protein
MSLQAEQQDLPSLWAKRQHDGKKISWARGRLGLKERSWINDISLTILV